VVVTMIDVVSEAPCLIRPCQAFHASNDRERRWT